MDRRRFLTLAGALAFGTVEHRRGRALERPQIGNLLRAPIELRGEWAYRDAVRVVLSRARAVDLSGLRLISDRQPLRISVENHAQGSPAIWLHSDEPERASIIVNIGPSSDWCKLAYQFGHELGHVLSNSWQFSAKPQPPTQWLEEALVEAFSIRGLGSLAASWRESPPFAGDSAFSSAIHHYRSDLMAKNNSDASSAMSLAEWFKLNRDGLEYQRNVSRGPAIQAIVALFDEPFEEKTSCAEELGALNRWPERTALPIRDYLLRWKRSCNEIGASGALPTRLEQLFFPT